MMMVAAGAAAAQHGDSRRRGLVSAGRGAAGVRKVRRGGGMSRASAS